MISYKYETNTVSMKVYYLLSWHF